jgi:hypothetical protein
MAIEARDNHGKRPEVQSLFHALNKGAIVSAEHNSPQQNFFKTQHIIILAHEESIYANRENTRKKRHSIRLV